MSRLGGYRSLQARFIIFLLPYSIQPEIHDAGRLFDEAPSPSLLYFQAKLAVPVAVQLVHSPGICKKVAVASGTLWVISADRWLGLLV